MRAHGLTAGGRLPEHAMLRTVALLLALLLGGGAAAQTADTPPSVFSAPPSIGADQSVPEPSSELSALSPVPSVAAAMPETDLVTLVATAHPVVQAVMALLAAAIFAVLTIFLFKAVEFTLAFARLRRTASAIAAMPGLTIGCADACPLAATARAAQDEAAALSLPLTADLRASARDRLELSLARIEAGAVQRLRAGTGLLASIGSVAPFVGLFGTVFGIMNSFLAIAATQTTSLSVVAPGIAEALLATGVGLAAAIPAVLLYNQLMRQIVAFRHRLADGTAEVLRRFSRELDTRMAAEG